MNNDTWTGNLSEQILAPRMNDTLQLLKDVANQHNEIWLIWSDRLRDRRDVQECGSNKVRYILTLLCRANLVEQREAMGWNGALEFRITAKGEKVLESALNPADQPDPQLTFPASVDKPEYRNLEILYTRFEDFDRQFPSIENKLVLTAMVNLFAKLKKAEAALYSTTKSAQGES